MLKKKNKKTNKKYIIVRPKGKIEEARIKKCTLVERNDNKQKFQKGNKLTKYRIGIYDFNKIEIYRFML